MLTTNELNLLQYHSSNHYIVKKLLPNYLEIRDYYDSVPNSSLLDLISLLSPLDRKKYFSFTDFPKWYSELNDKIHNNTTVKIFGITNDYINSVALELLSKIIFYSLTEHTMQQLVQHILKRNLYDVLNLLLLCLGANGDFSEYTLHILNIDVQNQKRWISLGLSQAPSLEDIESIFV